MSVYHSEDAYTRYSDTFYEPVSTGKLETSLKRVSQNAAVYESQMRDLEARLSHHLNDFRKVGSDLRQALHTLQVNSKRGDRALAAQVPRIEGEFDVSMHALTRLGKELPVIRSQVNSIANVYLSGHETARILVSELDWLNTDFYERWRRTILTSTSPVSRRRKSILRTLFIISFMICVWLFWMATAGAYHTYRHRFVWGYKPMS